MKLFKSFLNCCIIIALIACIIPIPVSAAELTVGIFSSGASADGESKMDISSFALASKFKVTEGRFVGFLLNELYTVTTENQGTVKIYKWNTDYATTIAKQPIFNGIIENQVYNSSANPATDNDYIIKFNRAYIEGEYLAVIQGEDSMFLWTHKVKDGVTSFIDGEVYVDGSFKMSYIVDNEAKVNESPIETSILASTTKPTSSPVLTGSSVPSTFPKASVLVLTSAPKDKDKDVDVNNKLVPILIAGAAVIIIAAIAVILIKKKNNK